MPYGEAGTAVSTSLRRPEWVPQVVPTSLLTFTLSCYARSMPRLKLPRPPCLVCGAPTRTPQNTFCGRACSSAARSTAIDRTCEQCGETFPFRPTPTAVERGAGHFCSTRCANEAKRKHQRPPELPCAFCGTPFRTSGRPAGTRYCSSDCFGRARRQPTELPPCARCGAIRVRKIGRSAVTYGRYCSSDCRSAERLRRVTRVCPVCQRTYEVRPCEVAAGVRLRCSLKCRGVARRKPLTVPCQREGCEKMVTLSKKAALARRYCSRQCFGIARRTAIASACQRAGCEGVFLVKPSQRAIGQGRYCSNACRTIASRLRYPRVSVRCTGCRRRVTAPAWRKRAYCSHACVNRVRHRRQRTVLATRDLRILELHALGLKAPTIAAMMAVETPAWDLAAPLIRKVVSLAGR